jgi:DNA replication protein DnaC
VLEELRVYPLLIIDDLMSGNCSATDMEIIAEIIKEIYISKKQLLVTTNLLPNELESALGYHELSRLFGMGSWVEVKGEDRRMDVCLGMVICCSEACDVWAAYTYN